MMDTEPQDRRPALPPGAGRLVLAVGVLAVVLAAAVTVVGDGAPDLGPVLVLAALIAAGEAFTIDLGFRRGGTVTFSLSDTALTAGLLLLDGPEVVAAGALAVVGLQIVERMPPFKQAFNLAQTVAGFAAAALVVELLAPPELGAASIAATALGLAVLGLVNTAAIGGMIARSSGQRWRTVARRLAPAATLLLAGNSCLGILVVVLIDSAPWAVTALAVPIVLLHRASRAEVSAQVGRERAQAQVGTEQRLAEARDPAAVAVLLAEGAAALLGGEAAVWMDDRWATPVPAGSGPCPIDPALATALRSHGRALGPATDGPAAAIGLDGAVLVLWGDDLRLDHDGEEWLGRLAASGRVHLARAAVADALAEEQATLRAVVDGTADGICVLDAAGVLRVWNPAMATLAGVAADAALDRPAHEVLGDGPWTVDGVHDVVRHGERVWRVSVAAVDEGALRVAVVHDVSAERRVARMKDDMLAVVSHELRTPLTPIKGSAQLLLRRWERLPDEQRERLLAQVVSSAEHLSRLVDDLLLVAQLSASSTSTPSVALVPTDLGTVVSDGVAAMRLGHPDHRIELVATAATSGLSDPLRVRQVLDNLVANACKFSPAGSAVRVALDVDGADAVLRVVDEGRGIPPEDIERVFERFERAEDPLVMTTSGAGLGLYIVRALVTALGGTIALRSTPGAGTTAIVRLPLLARPAGQREGSASSSLVSSSEASLSS